MTTAHQINAETMAVNSALFRLQSIGWRVTEVNDGEDIISIRKASSQLRARRQAVEEAYSVDVARIHLERLDNKTETMSLLIVWGNGAECVIADYSASRDWMEELGRILDI